MLGIWVSNLLMYRSGLSTGNGEPLVAMKHSVKITVGNSSYTRWNSSYTRWTGNECQASSMKILFKPYIIWCSQWMKIHPNLFPSKIYEINYTYWIFGARYLAINHCSQNHIKPPVCSQPERWETYGVDRRIKVLHASPISDRSGHIRMVWKL